MAGVENSRPLSVSPYPVAWRIEVVNDDIHRGFEYVRYMTSHALLERLTNGDLAR